ncbi:hypothetical protein ACWDE0_29485 [Streptomyces sp. 900105755]
MSTTRSGADYCREAAGGQPTTKLYTDRACHFAQPRARPGDHTRAGAAPGA